MLIKNLRKSFHLATKESIRWFPGHMGKGLKQMQQKLRQIDCIIEVHDARIPLSGRNTEFHHTLTGAKPTILVLNKKDTVLKGEHEMIVSKLSSSLDLPPNRIILTNCKDQRCEGVRKIVPTAINLIKNSNRFNRSEEKENNIMIIGVPNVGKSSLINILRSRYLKMKGASQVGAVAGITRSVLTRIKMSEDPLIYVLDTPGVLTPSINNVEHGMKLALCSCFQDHLVGFENIADYLLYFMNKQKNLLYMEAMGLEEPTDEIIEVLMAGARKMNYFKAVRDLGTNQIEKVLDLDMSAKRMVKMFRNGEFGRFCLDKLQ